MQIAIIGSGQLARMLALAGWPQGFSFSFLAEPHENTQSVDGLGQVVIRTNNLTGIQLFQALGEPDVVTVEREHVDTVLLNTLKPFCAVYPDSNAIEVCQHRSREKQFLNSLGIHTAPFRLATTLEQISSAAATLSFPVFVKTCEEGYDGLGQWVIRNNLDLNNLLDYLLRQNANLPELVIEGAVNFDRELSLIAVRNSKGECAFYPLTENLHRDGILLSSIAPAKVSEALQDKAEAIADKLLNAWSYVGVIAIELFQVGENLVVNELAPRVHNSGHWTQAASISSQFSNHLRAITGLGLGTTKTTDFVGMVNLLGTKASKEIASMENVQLHLYNKAIRPGRKVGHLNLIDTNRAALESQVNTIRQQLYQA